MKPNFFFILLLCSMALPAHNVKSDDQKLPVPTYDSSGNWTQHYGNSIIDLIEDDARKHNPKSAIANTANLTFEGTIDREMVKKKIPHLGLTETDLKQIESNLDSEIAIDFDNDGIFDVFITIRKRHKSLYITYSNDKRDMIPPIVREWSKNKTFLFKYQPSSEQGLKNCTKVFKSVFKKLSLKKRGSQP